jgi:NADP-dependent aldehyde dehydrogenase
VTIASVDPRHGRAVQDVARATTAQELDAVCAGAAAAAAALGGMDRGARAHLLGVMADSLEDGRDALIGLADRETALGPSRLHAELTRTCYQLRFFADVLDEGSYLEAAIDHAGDTPMGARPDLRRMLRPLGVVAVFGASNFPFAFSVPGGDTASALAAGCPVIVKVHEAHPATSVAAHAALAAGAAAGAPDSAVSLVFGQDSATALVRHPVVSAVGFTGSLSTGRMLAEIASSRPTPIPFYGELGALNAVVVCPDAARRRSAEIAAGLVTSYTLGVGQFCTKPGLVLVPAGTAGADLLAALAERVAAAQPGAMLSDRTVAGYASRSSELQTLPGVRRLATAPPPGAAGGYWATPQLLTAEPDALRGILTEECFGPLVVAVQYRSADELTRLISRLRGALTGTVHATAADHDAAQLVVDQLVETVGRVVWNGYPTGVAVTWAMHDGGPYPATTDPLHTSVGAAAIRRWLRPISYQNVPEELLPVELRDGDAPVPRRINGDLVLAGSPPGTPPPAS